jgi:hypothetical protein
MTDETVKCPHCGLRVTIARSATGKPTLKYDIDEWRRLCKHPRLNNPALCFTEPAGGKPPSHA